MEPNGDRSLGQATGGVSGGGRREPSFEELLAELDGPDPIDGVATHVAASTLTQEEGEDSDSLDLDSMLADLGRTPTADGRAAVRGQAERLLASFADGASAVQGSSPQGDSPPPVVAHDTSNGTLFTAFDPMELDVVVHDTVEAGIVELVIAGGGYGVTATTMSATVAAVKRRYLAIAGGQATAEPDEPHLVVITTLLAARPKLVTLCGLVGTPDLDLPLPHAAAFVHVTEVYPGFWTALAHKGVRFRFKSSRADGRGGGLFEQSENTIHMSLLPVTPPGAFIRLLVHETGHALFETALLDDRPMPVPMSAGAVFGLPAQFAPLPPGTHEPKDLSREGLEIEQFQAYWDGMSPAAKAFFHAWTVLRRHRSSLLGLELWRDPKDNRLSPEQRRSYQADSFSEFCAETFMQFAMGDLHPYLVALLGDHGLHPDVRAAWRLAWHVLETVAAPILGPRHG
ncbi:MAG: hypothetical protein HOV94_28765 [Saccharothrix sp.]|nr:hypothetical protein [Saccharothrix sp.]